MTKINIQNYTVRPDDQFFFDTNVWIFLFSTISNAKAEKQERYSKILRDIIDRGSIVWINSLVISEYINATLRLAFNQWKQNGNIPNTYLNRADCFKKLFRPTLVYTQALENIADQVKEILQIAKRRTDDFNAVDINKIIENMGNDCDFNDSYIIDCCQQGNYKLVSDDRDMEKKSSSITLITD